MSSEELFKRGNEAIGLFALSEMLAMAFDVWHRHHVGSGSAMSDEAWAAEDARLWKLLREAYERWSNAR